MYTSNGAILGADSGVVDIDDYAAMVPNFGTPDFTPNTPTLPTGPVSVKLSFISGIAKVNGVAYSTSSLVPVQPGNTVSFGIQVTVTGNADSASGGAWDLNNQAMGNPALPVNLGLGSVGITIPAATEPTLRRLPATVPLMRN